MRVVRGGRKVAWVPFNSTGTPKSARSLRMHARELARSSNQCFFPPFVHLAQVYRVRRQERNESPNAVCVWRFVHSSLPVYDDRRNNDGFGLAQIPLTNDPEKCIFRVEKMHGIMREIVIVHLKSMHIWGKLLIRYRFLIISTLETLPCLLYMIFFYIHI